MATIIKQSSNAKNKTKSKQGAIKKWQLLATYCCPASPLHLSHSFKPENFSVFICGILRIYLFRLPFCVPRVKHPPTFNPPPTRAFPSTSLTIWNNFYHPRIARKPPPPLPRKMRHPLMLLPLPLRDFHYFRFNFSVVFLGTQLSCHCSLLTTL